MFVILKAIFQTYVEKLESLFEANIIYFYLSRNVIENNVNVCQGKKDATPTLKTHESKSQHSPTRSRRTHNRNHNKWINILTGCAGEIKYIS